MSPRRAKARLLGTVGVSFTLMVAEIFGGIWADSLALLADAGHMLTDVLALLVAFAALALSDRAADARRTYGYKRLEILAALANGIALVVISGGIAYEAIERWNQPRVVNVEVMAAVAALGLVANLIGLGLLSGHGHNLNMRGAFLHVLGDTLSSVGVLVGAVVIWQTGWTRIDAIISMGIACVIVVTSVRLLREVIDVLLESAPPHINTEQVRSSIESIDGIEQVHDLHIWSITSGMPALSVHVVVDNEASNQRHTEVLKSVQERLRREFDIEHATVQIESDTIDCGCC